MTKICKLEGCGTSHYGHGYCEKHYGRNKRCGDPTVTLIRERGSDLKTFLLSNREISKNGCWNYLGVLHATGYAVITINKKQEGVHRVSWKLFKGEIPGGLWVLHKCDNRKCFNPEHLFLGTQKDNMTDMVNKRRSAFGVKNSHAKLDGKKVKEIRNSEKSARELARVYGVGQITIRRVVRRKTWKHVV